MRSEDRLVEGQVQVLLKKGSGSEEPALDRAFRLVKRLSDLIDIHVPEVAHKDDLLVLFRKSLNRFDDLTLSDRSRCGAVGFGRIGEHVFVLIEGITVSLSRTYGVDAAVGTDSAEPRLEWSLRVEIVYRTKSLKQGVLDRVVGIIGIAQHPHRLAHQHRPVHVGKQLKRCLIASGCSNDQMGFPTQNSACIHFLLQSPQLETKNIVHGFKKI